VAPEGKDETRLEFTTASLELGVSRTPIVLAEPTAPVLARETSTNATETTTPPSLAVPSEVVQPSQIPNTSKTAQTPQKPRSSLPAAVTQPAPSPETTDKPETKPTPRLEEIIRQQN